MTAVSVITPVYNSNRIAYERTEGSLRNQTSQDFEWIVVDDGSTDFIPNSSIRTEANYGASVARNLGFQISSGSIIAYLDMGDEYYPSRIQHIIDLYNQYKLNIVFDSYDMIYDENPQSLFHFNHFNYIGNSHFPTAIEYFELLNTQNISIPLGVSHTRKPFVQCGGFQRGVVCGEDGILWRRMKQIIPPNTAMFTDYLAGCYYISNNGQSRTQRRPAMGGFAFNGSKNDNGRYLDESWFKEFSSKDFYE